ncbi:reverse transcriptase domain-containing protein [Tanacetum coccineum]
MPPRRTSATTARAAASCARLPPLMVMAMEATILTLELEELSSCIVTMVREDESVFHISNCAVENQVKFTTCTFLGNALTWWNSHMKTVTQDVAYAMDWKALKKMMTVKYCPRGEIKKLEIELWNLKVKEEVEKYVGGLLDMIRGNVMSYQPKTMEKAIEFSNDQMDQKGHQQQNKRQNTRKAYTAGPGEKKEYTGSLPLCTKGNYPPTKVPRSPCNKCKKISHLARECRSSGPNGNNNNRGNLETTQNDVTCYECGVPGANFKTNYPKLKNETVVNQRRNSMHRAKVYVWSMLNKFRLNSPYYIPPPQLIVPRRSLSYSWEMQPSLLHGNRSNQGNRTRLNIISCTKTHKYCIERTIMSFWCTLTTKETKDKSGEKRLKDVLIVRDFAEVFPEDLSGLPPTRQVGFQIDLIPGAAPVA